MKPMEDMMAPYMPPPPRFGRFSSNEPDELLIPRTIKVRTRPSLQRACSTRIRSMKKCMVAGLKKSVSFRRKTTVSSLGGEEETVDSIPTRSSGSGIFAEGSLLKDDHAYVSFFPVPAPADVEKLSSAEFEKLTNDSWRLNSDGNEQQEHHGDSAQAHVNKDGTTTMEATPWHLADLAYLEPPRQCSRRNLKVDGDDLPSSRRSARPSLSSRTLGRRPSSRRLRVRPMERRSSLGGALPSSQQDGGARPSSSTHGRPSADDLRSSPHRRSRPRPPSKTLERSTSSRQTLERSTSRRTLERSSSSRRSSRPKERSRSSIGSQSSRESRSTLSSPTFQTTQDMEHRKDKTSSLRPSLRRTHSLKPSQKFQEPTTIRREQQEGGNLHPDDDGTAAAQSRRQDRRRRRPSEGRSSLPPLPSFEGGGRQSKSKSGLFQSGLNLLESLYEA